MRRMCFAAIVLAGALGTSVFAQFAAPLTQAQVEALVRIQTPDAAVRQEMEGRGLAFHPDEAFVARLRKMGAGTRTLALLTERARSAVLAIVNAPEGAEVSVDGIVRRIGADGRLEVQTRNNVPHEVVIRHARHQPRTVAVPPTKNARIEIDGALAWAVGFLTINVPPGASVEIAGHGTYEGPSVTVDLPPGKHAITVTAPRFRSETLQLEIEAGKPTTTDARLTLDESYANGQVAEARRLLASGSLDRARTIARALLQLQPDYAGGDALLAEAAFVEGAAVLFSAHGRRALGQGGKLDVPLKHHHAVGSVLHPVTLTLDRSGVGFDPRSSECTIKPFVMPWALMRKLEVTGNRSNEVYLRLTLASGKGTAELKLSHIASIFQRGEKSVGGIGLLSYRGSVMVSPPFVSQAMEVLRSVMESASKGEIAVNSPPPAPSAGPAPEGDLVGRWTGSVTQAGYGSYPVAIDFGAGQTAATVKYPTLGCSSEWVYERDAGGGAVRFAERITDGASRCVSEAVVLRRTPSGLALEFMYQGRVIASGTASRVTAR